jgi:hypothetical protein
VRRPRLLDQHERLLESIFNNHFFWNGSRCRYAVLPRREPVRLCAIVPESRNHRRPRKARQRAERVHTKPPKRCNKLIHPEYTHFEIREKRCIVVHDPPWRSDCPQPGGERPLGDREQSSCCLPFDGCHDLGEHRLLAPVVADRTLDAYEREPRRCDLHTRYHLLYSSDDRFECHNFCPEIPLHRHAPGTERLRLAATHPERCSFRCSLLVDGHDAIVRVDDDA